MENKKVTQRLFYDNVYKKDFKAEVCSCGEDDAGYYAVLTRTAFYPEGGGQPSDRGVMYPDRVGDDDESKPKINVLDVQYAGGEIRHYVDEPLHIGETVRGEIDWKRRFDLMQQHSGEHIVSGFIHEKYGYDNVGFHMSEDVVTIDISGILTQEQVEELEEQVNHYIWTNRKTNIFIPDEQKRKDIVYRSKKELEGEVRLVQFPGADCCACCGLHVEETGEIGLVKLLSVKHFREGVRIEMVSGKRAFDLLNGHFQANSQVAVDLSVKPKETAAAVQRLQEENYTLKGQIIQIRSDIFEMKAKQCAGKENVLLFETHLEAADIRKEADRILDDCLGVCVVMSGEDGAGYKYAMGTRKGDIRELLKEMNTRLHGRGGGKALFAQGSLSAEKEQVKAFFADKMFTIF